MQSMVFQWFLVLLPSLSMVFDGFGPLVKRCDGFDGSSWSNCNFNFVPNEDLIDTQCVRWWHGSTSASCKVRNHHLVSCRQNQQVSMAGLQYVGSWVEPFASLRSATGQTAKLLGQLLHIRSPLTMYENSPPIQIRKPEFQIFSY